MDKELIQRLAKEAELASPNERGELVGWYIEGADLAEYIAKFATLVAEECAKACDGRAVYYEADDDGPRGRDHSEDTPEELQTVKSRRSLAAEACAMVIRHKFAKPD